MKNEVVVPAVSLPIPGKPEAAVLSVVSEEKAAPTPSRLAPGFAAKMNMVADVVLVVAALLISTSLMGHDLHLERTDVWVLLGRGGRLLAGGGHGAVCLRRALRGPGAAG